ncbi:MAG: PEP-CTERM sorting domain-containing protein [Verrucomicrobiota bacterium]
MKKVLVALVFSAFTIQSHAAVLQLSDVEFWVGSGSNEAGLVIDFNDGTTTESFAWGYRWDGTASGADMLLAVVAADSQLSLTSSGTGSSGFFLSQIGYFDGVDSHSETNGSFAVHPADYLSWGYYIAGGFAGDDQPFVAGGNPVAIGGGGVSLPSSWTSSPSGASLDSFGDSGRILTDGSWDAWSFGQNSTSFVHEVPPGPESITAAVPEPSTFLLLSIGLGLLGFSRRRR